MNAQPLFTGKRARRLPRRAWAALGLLLGTAVLFTAAIVTEKVTFEAQFAPGNDHVFNLQVAGSDDLSWRPAESDWAEGNPETLTIGTTANGGGIPLPPGGTQEFLVAVRNASPTLGTTLTIKLFDPDPLGEATDPVTGNKLELFEALQITLKDGLEVVADSTTANLSEGATLRSLASSEQRFLTLSVHLPEGVTNEYNGARTGIGIRFEGSSL